MKKDKDTAVVAQSTKHPTLSLRQETRANIASPSLWKSQGGHGRAQHRVGQGAVVAALLLPKHLLPCNTLQYLAIHAIHICTGTSKHPGVGSHKVGILLKRTKISPHPHNASVREDLLKDYIHTKIVIKSRATSAPSSCSPIHAMACHKKHAKKHWHEDSFKRDTSKCSPKGGRGEGCGCMCSKFLSSSYNFCVKKARSPESLLGVHNQSGTKHAVTFRPQAFAKTVLRLFCGMLSIFLPATQMITRVHPVAPLTTVVGTHATF